jgi:uncharacterized coiled-coil DUF342 family protein
MKNTNIVKEIEELNKAVAKVKDIKAEYSEVMDGFNETLQELKNGLASLQQDKVNALNVESAKAIVKEISTKQAEVSLTEGVMEANRVKKLAQVESAIVEVLEAHRKANTAYYKLHQEFKGNVSLNSLKADTEELQGLANIINQASSFASRNLIGYGIITQGTAMYAGYHLSSRPAVTELATIFTPDARRGF